MSQTFTELQGDTTLTASRTILNTNADALKTDFSGTSAPFTASASVVGATYYNTSDKKVYRVVAYGSGYSWRAENDNIPTVENGTISNEAANAEFVTKSVNKTNCITEIPQDIKLELNNGTLTLKSGSVVTYANGTQYTTTADKTTTFTTNGQWLLVCSGDGTPNVCIYPGTSGSSEPSPQQTRQVWYDTTNNVVKRYNGSIWETRTLPIAIITVSGGAITSIDQVFNGFGYIGSSLFVLPGVKLLFAQGFNADGTLKSERYTVSSVIVRTETTGTNTYGMAVGGAIGLGTPYIYDSKTNYLYATSISPTNKRPSLCLVGTTRVENGVIKSLDVNTVFHAVDYNEVPKLNTDNIFTGNNTFTAPEFRMGTTGTMISGNQGGVDLVPTSTANNGGYIDFHYNGSSSDYTSRIIENASGTLTIKASNGVNAPTPEYSDNSTKVATTAWGHNFANGMRSNCITEIPQDINLTLSNGTLTLKSGSVITSPDGTQLQTGVDNSVTISTNGVYIIFAVANSGSISTYSSEGVIKSGSSLPESGTFGNIFYNTSDNKIYRYTTQWTTWSVSFPIAKVTVSNGAISSIDQVFNGAGYIGHHAFVLPGVKGLAPKGFNADGTLSNLTLGTTAVNIQEMSSTPGRVIGFQGGNNIGSFPYKVVDKVSELQKEFMYQYCRETNTVWLWQNNAWSSDTRRLPVAVYNYNGTSVTQFDIKPVFHAVDYNDLEQTNTNIATLDSQNAKLTGDQTIAGTKTFSSTIVGNISGNAATATSATSATSATNATNATNDGSGNNISTTYAKIAQPITATTYASTITLTNNTIHKVTLTGDVTFSLPTVSDTSSLSQILVQLYMSTARTINLGTTYYFGGEAPDLSMAGYYDLIYEYDAIRNGWVVGALLKKAVS